jgi:hypothetical protein
LAIELAGDHGEDRRHRGNLHREMSGRKMSRPSEDETG